MWKNVLPIPLMSGCFLFFSIWHQLPSVTFVPGKFMCYSCLMCIWFTFTRFLTISSIQQEHSSIGGKRKYAPRLICTPPAHHFFHPYRIISLNVKPDQVHFKCKLLFSRLENNVRVKGHFLGVIYIVSGCGKAAHLLIQYIQCCAFDCSTFIKSQDSFDSCFIVKSVGPTQ